jgi:hypothetical protein
VDGGAVQFLSTCEQPSIGAIFNRVTYGSQATFTLNDDLIRLLDDFIETTPFRSS